MKVESKFEKILSLIKLYKGDMDSAHKIWDAALDIDKDEILTPEQMAEIIRRTEKMSKKKCRNPAQRCSQNYLKYEIYDLCGFDSIIKYLETNPEQYGSIALGLSKGEFRHIYIENENIATNLILHSKDCRYEIESQIPDLYVRHIAFLNYYNKEKQLNIDDFKESIKKYYEFERTLMGIPYEERSEAIANFSAPMIDINFCKQSLLSFLDQDDVENRQKVINGMEPNVDKSLQEEWNLVYQMFKEYAETHQCFSDEMKRRLELVFRRDAVHELPKRHFSSDGCYYPRENRIFVVKNTKKHDLNVRTLAHEYVHAISEDLTMTDRAVPFAISEGMADTVADVIIHSYMRNHPETRIHGDKMSSKSKFLESDYIKPNQYVRTMLYPLEKEGKDAEAIAHYLLGSKEHFMQMTLGEPGPTLLFNKNPFSSTRILEQLVIKNGLPDRDSVYANRNLFPMMTMLKNKTWTKKRLELASKVTDRHIEDDTAMEKQIVTGKVEWPTPSVQYKSNVRHMHKENDDIDR